MVFVFFSLFSLSVAHSVFSQMARLYSFLQLNGLILLLMDTSIFWLLSVMLYWTQGCIYIFLNQCFCFLWVKNTQKQNCWTIWQFCFRFLRTLCAVFHRGCASAHSNHSAQGSLVPFMTVVLIETRCYLVVGFDLHFPDDQ